VAIWEYQRRCSQLKWRVYVSIENLAHPCPDSPPKRALKVCEAHLDVEALTATRCRRDTGCALFFKLTKTCLIVLLCRLYSCVSLCTESIPKSHYFVYRLSRFDDWMRHSCVRCDWSERLERTEQRPAWSRTQHRQLRSPIEDAPVSAVCAALSALEALCDNALYKLTLTYYEGEPAILSMLTCVNRRYELETF